MPTGQPSAIEQRMAGLTSVLGQLAAQPAPQPAMPSPMGGLGGLGLPIG